MPPATTPSPPGLCGCFLKSDRDAVPAAPTTEKQDIATPLSANTPHNDGVSVHGDASHPPSCTLPASAAVAPPADIARPHRVLHRC